MKYDFSFKFLKIFSNKKLMFLFIFLCIIILSSFFFKSVEGFGLSSSSSFSSSSEPSIPKDYEYLKPITGTWSEDTQTKFIAKLNEGINPNGDDKNTVKKEWLTTTPPGFLGLFYPGGITKWVTEEEALYYIENGSYPYDDYVTNYLTKEADPPVTPENLDNTKKLLPNRVIYSVSISTKTVPGADLLVKMANTGGVLDDEKTEWRCYDGNLMIRNNRQDPTTTLTKSTDYSFFTKNFPGFQFQGDEPCNPCEWPKLTLPPDVSIQDYLGRYNNPENKCKFTMPGAIPEAYNIYMGDFSGLSASSSSSNTSESTPTSLETNDEYKQCVADCGKSKKKTNLVV